jgi:hypothetical protein
VVTVTCHHRSCFPDHHPIASNEASILVAEQAVVAAAAAGRFAGVARAARAGAADLLLNLARNQFANRDLLLDRDAARDGPGGLERHALGNHHRAGLLTVLGDALADRYLDLLGLGNHLADGHVALLGDALPGLLDPRAGDLLADDVGAPHLDRLGTNAFRFALAAVVLVEVLVQAFREARAARHFAALVVAAIAGLGDIGRHRLAHRDALGDGPLFNRRNAVPDGAGAFLDHGHHFGAADGARPGFRNALGAVGGVFLGLADGLVNRPHFFHRRGSVLGDRHGTGCRGAVRVTTVGPSRKTCGTRDDAREQSETSALQDHACFSLDAVHTWPRRPLNHSGGRAVRNVS